MLPLGTLNSIGHYGRYLQVVPPEELNGQIQTGTRISDKEWNAAKKQRIKQWYEDTAAENHMPLVQPIWPVWSDSDPTSWSEELRNFWYGMDSVYSNKRPAIVQSIRTYYPEDEKLTECANFIEYWTGKHLKLTLNIKYEMFGSWQDSVVYVLAGAAIPLVPLVLVLVLKH
jgi:hypothetical protein